VPARNAVPISCTLAAPPLAIAVRITLRPTPKQAQITGPGSARPAVDFPDSTARLCASPRASLAREQAADKPALDKGRHAIAAAQLVKIFRDLAIAAE